MLLPATLESLTSDKDASFQEPAGSPDGLCYFCKKFCVSSTSRDLPELNSAGAMRKENHLCLALHCSLDQSEAAFGSEDFPGSRWRYQAGIVEALAERLYFQHGAQADKAHLSAARSLRGAQHSLCMLSGTSAKLLCPPAPLTERAAVLARLHGLQPCCGASSNLAFALKLAAVCPLHLS